MKKIYPLACLFIVFFLTSCKKETKQGGGESVAPDQVSAARTSTSSIVLWQKCLGSSGNDDGASIAAALDPVTGNPLGYFLVGTAGANGGDVIGNHGLTDAWIVKRKLDGSQEWQLAIGGTGYDYGKGVAATPDGGCIVVINGQSTDGDFSSLGSSKGLVVVKVSNSGSIVWAQRYGTGIPNAAIKTNDGGVAITGYISAPNAVDPQESMFLTKLNADPSVTSDQPYLVTIDKTYGLPATHGETGYGLCETESNGFALTGCSYSPVNSDPSFYVVGTDANGNELWHKLFPGNPNSIGWGVTSSHDGNVIAVGRVGSDMGVYKLNNTSGALTWQTTYLGGKMGSITGLAATCTTLDCIVTGYTSSTRGEIISSNGGEDQILVKLGLDGTKKTSYSFGGSNNERGKSIIASADGTNTYWTVGYTASNNGTVSGNHGGQDMWMVKVNAP